MTNVINFPDRHESEKIEDYHARIPRGHLEASANSMSQEIALLVHLVEKRVRGELTISQFGSELANMDCIFNFGLDPDGVKEAFREDRPLS